MKTLAALTTLSLAAAAYALYRAADNRRCIRNIDTSRLRNLDTLYA